MLVCVRVSVGCCGVYVCVSGGCSGLVSMCCVWVSEWGVFFFNYSYGRSSRILKTEGEVSPLITAPIKISDTSGPIKGVISDV